MLSFPEIFGVMFKLVVQFSITGTHDDQSPYIQLHCNVEYTWVCMNRYELFVPKVYGHAVSCVTFRWMNILPFPAKYAPIYIYRR